MEPNASIPRSQEPATCPYPKPNPSRPRPTLLHYISWVSILIRLSYLRLGLPSGLSTSGFPTKTPHVPILSGIRAACPNHVILLRLTTLIVFGESCRPCSSSICIVWIFSCNIILRHTTELFIKHKLRHNYDPLITTVRLRIEETSSRHDWEARKCNVTFKQ